MHPFQVLASWTATVVGIAVLVEWRAILDWLNANRDLAGWVQAVGAIIAIPAAAWAALAPYRRQSDEARAARIQMAELAAARLVDRILTLKEVCSAVSKAMVLPAISGIVSDDFTQASGHLAEVALPADDQIAQLLHFPMPNIAHTMTDGLVLYEQAAGHLRRSERARANLQALVDSTTDPQSKASAETRLKKENSMNLRVIGTSLKYASVKFAQVDENFTHYFTNHPTIPATQIELLSPTLSAKSEKLL